MIIYDLQHITIHILYKMIYFLKDALSAHIIFDLRLTNAHNKIIIVTHFRSAESISC